MKPQTEGRVIQQAIMRNDGTIDPEMIALRVPERNITVAYVRSRDADYFEWAFNNAKFISRDMEQLSNKAQGE